MRNVFVLELGGREVEVPRLAATVVVLYPGLELDLLDTGLRSKERSHHAARTLIHPAGELLAVLFGPPISYRPLMDRIPRLARESEHCLSHLTSPSPIIRSSRNGPLSGTRPLASPVEPESGHLALPRPRSACKSVSST